MSFKKANRSFEIILSESRSIEIIINKNHAMRKIEKVENEIQLLSGYLLEIQGDHKLEIDRFNEELIELHEKKNDYTSKEYDYKKQQIDLNLEISNLNEKKSCLNHDLDDLNKEINEIKEQLRKEEGKRENAILDSIPVFGFFHSLVGAISNNEPERLIPYYSLVNGLISLSTQKKEELEQRCNSLNEEKENLNKDCDAVEKKLYANIQSLNENAEHLRKTKETIEEINRTINKLGEKTTSTKNILKSLEISRDKFLSFKNDLFMIKEGVDNEVLDRGDLRNFISQIQDIQRNFSISVLNHSWNIQ